MNDDTSSTNDREPNRRLNGDPGVRVALAARLLEEGFQLRNGEMARPVELIAGDPSAFVLSGRVIVPADQADMASTVVGDARITELEGTGLVAIDSGRSTAELLDALAAASITASADHLFMSAGRTYIKEGEDPEVDQYPSPKDPTIDGARVVVIDTGLDAEAFGSGWFNGVSLDTDDVDPLYSKRPTLGHGGGHGTFVGGIVRQIAPDCQLRFVRAFDVNGVGLESEIAAAILEARRFKPQFVLCAFGGYTFNDRPPVVIEAALGRLRDAVVVAAGGNERQKVRPLWPAAFRDVKAIAAVESETDGTLVIDKGQAQLAWFSNTGPTIEFAAAGRWASVFASGEEDPRFESDGRPDTFEGSARMAGTSMAAAAVVGALAAVCGGGDPLDAWTRITSATIPIAGESITAIDIWT